MTSPATAPRRDESESLLVAIGRYARNLDKLRRGNAVTPLRTGGEAFPEMLAAIRGATRSVGLETYILNPDRTGLRFADALCERAAAGVTVRLMYDAIGGIDLTAPFLTRLREAGVEIVVWNPIAPWRGGGTWSHRDHRKVLIVDDLVAFTGGLNIGDEYAAVADGGGGWHDIHCELRGPVVRDLARLFRSTWRKAGGPDYPAPPSADEPGAARAGQVAVRVLENSERRRRGPGTIRRAYLRAINAARTTVHLENAYFLPDAGIRRAMRRAVRRGVDVAVIVPGRSDVRIMEFATLYVCRRLAADGIRMLQWTGPMMHAKTAVIDGVWATIGTYNLDARSLRYNLELTIEIIDRDVGARMERGWQADQVDTRAFDAAVWDALSWWRQGLAWLAFRFRRLL